MMIPLPRADCNWAINILVRCARIFQAATEVHPFNLPKRPSLVVRLVLWPFAVMMAALAASLHCLAVLVTLLVVALHSVLTTVVSPVAVAMLWPFGFFYDILENFHKEQGEVKE